MRRMIFIFKKWEGKKRRKKKAQCQKIKVCIVYERIVLRRLFARLSIHSKFETESLRFCQNLRESL